MSIEFISKNTLQSYTDQTCFLRVDLNIQEGDENSSFRVDAIMPTLNLLSDLGIKTVIGSHRGRFDEQTPSMEVFASILSDRINEKVVFVGANYDRITSEDSQFVLIENLRSDKREEANDKAFAKKLAAQVDFYIQDGFAVCHRKNASVYHLPQLLPSFGGLLLEKEISNLTRAVEEYESPFTVIIGGAKTKTKIGVLDYLWDRVDSFLLGGGIANTCLRARGEDIGDSIHDEDSVKRVEKYLDSDKLYLPVDTRKDNNQILDIGPETESLFSEVIQQSKTVIWNGPLGYFEKEEFAQGSYAVARAIAASESFSIIGGGETTSLISNMGLVDDFSFVSTGGGAMLEFLSGNELPGLSVLE